LYLPGAALKRISGLSAVANLEISIAERQRSQALRRLRGRDKQIEIELLELPARGKGTFLLLLAEFRRGSACYVALGALGKRAEQVADEACLWLEKFLTGTGAVDEYLADQILLPLAFAEGPSEYRTARVTILADQRRRDPGVRGSRDRDHRSHGEAGSVWFNR
jgi:RNA 3'-terminal phosphate cyclase (ATP)